MRLIVGAGYDIRLRIRGWRRLVPHSQCATAPPGRVVYRALSGLRERTAEP